MSYKITCRIYQTNTNNFFQLVERTVWHYANGGTWTQHGDEQVLQMGGSGTSGTLRFQADNGENFIVALGVHNYKRWCDIVTNLTHTGALIQPQWYDSNHADRGKAREAQRTSWSATNAKGRKFEVHYTVVDGNDLRANIIIH